MTTGNFSSQELLAQELEVRLPPFTNKEAVAIGEIALQIATQRELPIAIEIRISDWTVFKAALPGSKPENDGWINRKARVVVMTGHSTLYERVRAEELGIDWHAEHGVMDETHAIHGGGIPLTTRDGNLVGVMIISGLPQVEDHQLGIEILRKFLSK
ncbi:MAG: heme-degrading domain-containing protein [Actinomycetota bacterium]